MDVFMLQRRGVSGCVTFITIECVTFIIKCVFQWSFIASQWTTFGQWGKHRCCCFPSFLICCYCCWLTAFVHPQAFSKRNLTSKERIN